MTGDRDPIGDLGADHITPSVLDVLDGLPRNGLNLYKVTLEAAPTFSPDDVRRLVSQFTTPVSSAPHSGCLFAFDAARDGMEHAHGVVVTDESADSLVQQWIAMSGSTMSTNEVAPIWFSQESWSLGTNPKLARALWTWLSYSLRSRPRRFAFAFPERVVAAGVLDSAWQEGWLHLEAALATQARSARSRPSPSPPAMKTRAQRRLGASRPCLDCGRPVYGRADKLRHDSCRKRTSKQKTAAQTTMQDGAGQRW